MQMLLFFLLAAILANGVTAASTCLGRCGDSPSSSYTCQCNDVCSNYGDCCSDYGQYCVSDSCDGKCFAAYDASLPCQCNDVCANYGNCCGDYTSLCTVILDSCDGKCFAAYDASLACQCNDVCSNYGNCCGDYTSLCAGTAQTVAPGTPSDMSAFATALLVADVNRVNVGTDIVVNTGTYISSSSVHSDVSSSRLFTSVDTTVLERPTFKAMIALFDNYITTQGNTETKTSTELAEEDAFLDAIFNTDVMLQAYEFVIAKGYFSGSISDYKEFIRGLLFTFYTRKATSDTSGFEHVLAGEWSSSSAVSGFHNWVRFYQLENDGSIDYHGYMSTNELNILKFQFTWSGRVKPVTSIMIGASPEFEVAIFSTCFLESPNSVCYITVNGNIANVQTYDYKGADVFGSAYFIG